MSPTKRTASGALIGSCREAQGEKGQLTPVLNDKTTDDKCENVHPSIRSADVCVWGR